MALRPGAPIRCDEPLLAEQRGICIAGRRLETAGNGPYVASIKKTPCEQPARMVRAADIRSIGK